MEYTKKTSAQPKAVAATPAPLQRATPAAPESAAPALLKARHVQAFAMRPAATQRQVARPALQAAALASGEIGRVATEQAGLTEQIDGIQRQYAGQALSEAVQRHAASALPATPPMRPQSVGDWVTVMRFQAQQMDGRRVSARESASFTQLQRQVSQTLLQNYRADRQNALQRQAEYAGHLANLHREPLGGRIADFVVNNVPTGERPALQRAVEEAVQRQQADAHAAKTADQLSVLQHHKAELDSQATQPIHERIQARRGAGNPLPEAIQRHLEHGLNHDLSAVRIHDDAEADKLAKSVNAVAFTTGSDIFFQSGKFNPNSQSGLELLAHEVTHTVQQSKGHVGKGIDPDAGLENEARDMGKKLASIAPKSLIPPVPHKDGLHAPSVYTPQAALKRAQAGAVQHTSLKPLRDLQPAAIQRDLIPGFVKDAYNNTVGKVVDAGVEKAKDALMSTVKGLPGYRELSLAFGKDLLTGSAMDSDPNSILTTLTNWVPGPLKDILKALKETNVIGKAWGWLKGQLAGLDLGGALGEIKDALLKLPPDVGAASRAVTSRIGKVKALITGCAGKIAEIGLTAISAGLGPLGQKIMAGLRGAGDTIIKVLKDPVAFAKHLIDALKGGFERFAGNAPKHLQNGIGQWLTGSTGITFPVKFDLAGIFMTALTVMGLTYQTMRGKLVRQLGTGGEAKVEKAEKTVSALQSLKGGIQNAQEMKASQGSVGNEVSDGIKKEVTSSLVLAGIKKIATMLVPGGGFINAIIGAFQTVQTVISQGAQIMQVVTNALSSVSAIASGSIGAAVGYIDSALGGAIPVALTWLGKLIGIGGIGGKIKGVIQKVRGKLDAVTDKIVKRIAQLVNKVMGKDKGKDRKAGDTTKSGEDTRTFAQKEADIQKAKIEAESLLEKDWDNKSKLTTALGSIKEKYRLKTIALKEDDDFNSRVYLEINPTGTTKKLHTMFYPINPEFSLDPKGIRIKYSTRAGKTFETVVGRSGHLRSTAGFDLDLTLLGRGTTQNPSNKTINSGQNSAHIIANWFGGSGYKRSLNLIATSDHFNKVIMGGIERNIAAWVAGKEVQKFNLYILADWGVVTEEALFKSIEMSIRSLSGITDVAKINKIKNSISRNLSNLKPALKAVENVQYTGHGKDKNSASLRMPAFNTGADKWIKI